MPVAESERGKVETAYTVTVKETAYTVTVIGGGHERRFIVMGKSHREALDKVLNRIPGFTDMNSIYIAESPNSEIITD